MPTKLTVSKSITLITSMETTSVIPAILIVQKTFEIQAIQQATIVEKTYHELSNTLRKTTETIIETKYAMPMYDENQKYLYTVLCPQQKSKIAQILVLFANDPKNSKVIFESFIESQLSIYLPVKE